MRKLNFILGLSVLSIGMLFTSCSKDDAQGPGLVINSDVEVETPANSFITIEWRADAGDANLDFFTIKEGNAAITDEDGILWSEYDIPSAENETFTGSARVQVGATNTSFTLIVTDKDGMTASKTVTVTIVATSEPIKSFTAILMGAQANDNGSALDAHTGLVYKFSTQAADNNQALVDIIYYYGNANLATLAAPNDETLASTASNSLEWTKDWTTQNATKFGASSVTRTEFDAMTNDELLSEISGLTLSKKTSLGEGNIVAFQTADGKKGLFKVVSLTAGTSGTITIAVKIQE